MNLSKDFDCIPHKLLIAKVHAYAFDLNSYSYLKNHKQNVKINNTCDIFQILCPSRMNAGSHSIQYFYK